MASSRWRAVAGAVVRSQSSGSSVTVGCSALSKPTSRRGPPNVGPVKSEIVSKASLGGLPQVVEELKSFTR